MVFPPEEIEKVHDLLLIETIDQISPGSPDDQRQRDEDLPPVGGDLDEKKTEDDQRRDGNSDQEDDADDSRSIGQDSEGGSGVPDVGQMKDPRNDFHGLMQGHPAFDSHFRPLIQNQDPAGDGDQQR